MSGLAEFQDRLGRAICGDHLSEADKALLGPVAADGLAFTARIRRSWCEGRIARAALLSLSALPAEERRSHVCAWVDAGGGTHSFIDAEAEAFLSFLAVRLQNPSHALTLCRFELAVVRARAAPPVGQTCASLRGVGLVRRGSNAAIIELTAPLERLLAALDGTAPWPPVTAAAQALLVAPGLSGHARPATRREIELWNAAEFGVDPNRDLRTAQRMIGWQALQPA